MSRCFPFPPPGYTLSSAKNEALIESIKFHKEKLRKKEKKGEKKEKRKERKETKKEKKGQRNQNSDKSDIVKGHSGQKTCLDPKDELFQKRRESESEQLEQSGLTEEHGHPGGLPFPTSSYDSTENSNKRKRHSSLKDCSHGHSKPILIRLPSKMQSDLHALANGQRYCSISGGTGFPAQHEADTGLRDGPANFCCTSEGTCNIGKGFIPINNREDICSTSCRIEALAPGKTGRRSRPKDIVSSIQEYKDLLENWFPPGLQDAGLYPVDSYWLFQDKRNQDTQAEKRQRSGSGSISCSRSSALWRCAEFLQEIDEYALPFVVPY